MERKTGEKLLSIIVPCYNEEKVIRLFHGILMDQMKKIAERRYNYELIYVNDGSSDGTQALILEFAEKNQKVKYIAFSRNFGKEAAMLAGLEHAAGDCACGSSASAKFDRQNAGQARRRLRPGYCQA